MALRRAITVYNRTVTTDISDSADLVLTGRKLRHLRPPFNISLKKTVPSTAPSGTITATLELQDSADGTTWADVSGLAVTIAGTGTKEKTASSGSQLREWVRARLTAAAGTWAGGNLYVGHLTADSGLS